MEHPAKLLERMSALAEANGRGIAKVEVRSPMVLGYDKFGHLSASAAIEAGINDMYRSEIRAECLRMSLGVC